MKDFPEKSGFNVPEQYFSQVATSIENNIKNPEIRSGFKVPDAYFTNNKAVLLKQNISKKKKIFRLQKQLIAIAASIVIGIGLYTFFNNTTPVTPLSIIEISDAITDEVIAIDTYTITAVFAEELEQEDVLEQNLTEYTQLIEYLSNTLENDELYTHDIP